MAEGLHEVDLWKMVWGCTSQRDVARLWDDLKKNFDYLESLCNCDFASIMRLRTFTAVAITVGIIRGLRFGAQLGQRSGGTIAESMLRHPSVNRLLLRGLEGFIPPYLNGTPDEPKENSRRKASTLEICRALDVVMEPVPWPDLRKKDRLWSTWAKNPTVKMAISNARKDALQVAIDEKFIALLKSIGDEGTVFERFQFKQRGLAKSRG